MTTREAVLQISQAMNAAVIGMLPRNRLGRAMLRKVRIYAGAEHPHEAQTPAAYELKSGRRAE